MIGSWWFIWMPFMFLFLVPSVGYGWGYRRWGPPYPRYFQRRRGERAAAAGASGTVDHLAWGWGGDAVWVVLLIGMVWAFSLAFWL